MVVASSSSKILSFALVVSLGANLFMAGWLLTGGAFRPGTRFPDRHGLKETLNASLSKAGAMDVDYALDRVREQFELQLDTARSDRDGEAEFLAAERFDRAAFLEERAKVHAAFSAATAESDKIVADALAQLSVEDRRKLASLRLPPPLGEVGRRPRR